MLGTLAARDKPLPADEDMVNMQDALTERSVLSDISIGTSTCKQLMQVLLLGGHGESSGYTEVVPASTQVFVTCG